MSKIHTPVLLKEVIAALRIKPGKLYIDATSGGFGHAEAILEAGGSLLGIDLDPFALEFAKEAVKKLSLVKGQQVFLKQGNFARMAEFISETGFKQAAGVVFDLGLSSWQLDQSGRGFRYAADEPLDMRFDPKNQAVTAADLVNKESRENLYEIFAKYAEEEHYREFVNALIRSRPIRTTGELLHAFGGLSLENKAKARLFQALRIAVNDELNSLKQGLAVATNLLEKGGRLAVISFHSLEDRLVKLTFARDQRLRRVNKKPFQASFAEIKANRRARSAKLRLAEKL